MKPKNEKLNGEAKSGNGNDEKTTKSKKLKPNKMATANIFSICTFWWMNSFFRKGYKNALQEEDMFELIESDTSDVVCSDLEKNWKLEIEKRKHKGKPSLARAMFHTYYCYMIKVGFMLLIEESLRVLHPLLVAALIGYFENTDTTPKWHAYAYAGGISAISLFLAIVHHVYFYHVQRIGWHMRSAMCALMYKKTLVLSQKSLGQTTTGQIVNLGATDVIRFDYLPIFLHYLWLGPAQTMVVGYLLWNCVGASALSGIGILAVIMTLQSLNGRAFGRLRMKTAILTDERVRLMNEVITGIKIIKMYTWEKSFADIVASVRRKEVKKILNTSILRAFNFSMFICSGKIVTCATFIVFVATGGELSASKVFQAMGLFNVIRISLGLFFPLAIEKFAESIISIRRIQTFLLLDEVSEITPDQNDVTSETKCKSFVELKNYSGQWVSNEESDRKRTLTLDDITAHVDAGQLLAVIGPVGAGKSSFLSAVLQELPTTNGSVTISGEISFASQVPWVFAGTVKENILFEEEYEEVWYNKVVQACGLQRDLELLPKGDQTYVGERGVTLSGGQKARVNLARAVYRKNASICLLDDPLSAVDPAVGYHIFEHCICGLLKDKVTILVTHQLQFLKNADKIIILKEGKIAGEGTYDELQADGTDFAALLQKQETEDDVVSSHFSCDEDDDTSVLIKPLKSPSQDSIRKRRINKSTKDLMSISQLSLRSAVSQDIKSIVEDEMGNIPLLEHNEFVTQEVAEEEREQGSIGTSVYVEYFRAGANFCFMLFFLVIMIASHVFYILSDWWLSLWSTRYDMYKKSLNMSTANDTNQMYEENSTYVPTTTYSLNETTTAWVPEPFHTKFYMILYAVITTVTYIVVLVRAVMHFYVCVNSGIHMHDRMFRSILRAPVRFFDTNPVGRILNRFSKDIGQIDDLLPMTFFDFLFISALILSILILSVSINYMVIIIILPLIGFFCWLRQYYLKTSRDIKRLEGSTRSPVFSLLSSTLQGLTTIRAFKVQNQFEEKFHQHQDLHSSAWFIFLTGSRWLGVRLDILSAAFITTVAFVSVATISLFPVDPGLVGLSLTYAVTLLGMFQWGVRQSTEVENLMTSVERVQQYYKVTPEADDEKPDQQPPPDWPKYGVITFDNASLAYYDGGPNVLKKIRLNIKAQEKIGIVGRTGAGKSSLISALFRLSELTGGEIYIDGIPITTLGLNDLRKVISIIPQDPILFTGPMRKNLDPFDKYSDADLWSALEQVQLKEVVESLPLKLSSELAESGSNFSVGQRQLVCLARAVLRKSKILVIDEATANVDLRTDRLIQLTIREKFKHCTVLTIAHRLNTIIDSDRVMVLDAGEVKEFDEPYALLQKPDSLFLKMVETTEGSETDLLKRMAKEAYNLQNGPSETCDQVEDKDRSYLARFFPASAESYDMLELETGL